MPDAWEELDEVEATMAILRAAAERGAAHADIGFLAAGGAEVCFVSAEGMELFARLPSACAERVRRYITQMASIDSFQPPPREGFSVYRFDGKEYTVRVRTRSGEAGPDLDLDITSL